MNSKKKARLSAATPGRAGETAAFGATASTLDFTASGGQISSLLFPGRENAVPIRDLCSATGLERRFIRHLIAKERLRGVPILSDNSSGYYLPANDSERAQFVRSMRHRAGEITRVADAVEQCTQGKETED